MPPERSFLREGGPVLTLKDKVVILTGCGRGIGRRLAEGFLASGCRLAGFELREELLKELAEAYPSEIFLPYPCDISRYASVKKGVEAVLERWGRIDVLVNNAGVDRVEFFADSSPETWEKLIAVNFVGPLNCTHAVLPTMLKAQKGRIIFIASDAGRVGSSGEAVYSGCKGGIIAFAKALAREVARAQITVNCIAPGPTETPGFHEFFAASSSDPEKVKKIQEGLIRAIPMKRMAKPEDLVPAVLFFASEEAGYITGQTLSVSGGLVMI